MINSELLESNSWSTEVHYKEFNKFNIFSYYEKELPTDEVFNFNLENFAYPIAVDPTCEYLKFITDNISNTIPNIENIKLSKAWFVNYPPNYTNEAHKHHHGRHFTAVLYLTDIETKNIDQKNGGALWTFHIDNNEIIHQVYSYESGKVVLLGGNVWHGTYPTHSPRKVFVCDFEYTINGV